MYKDKEKEKIYKKKYYQENKEKAKQYHKKWQKEHPEKVREQQRRYRLKYPEKIRKYYQEHLEERREYNKRYYQEHLEYDKKYYQEHKEEKKEYSKKYWWGHRKERLEYAKKHQKERKKTDSKFRLDCNMATAIWVALKNRKAGRKWKTLVGYSLEKLIDRLEYQFDNKMNWQNYGSYWWVDHKKARSLFNYTLPEEQAFKDCWCLANLQPLEKIENIKKSNHF